MCGGFSHTTGFSFPGGLCVRTRFPEWAQSLESGSQIPRGEALRAIRTRCSSLGLGGFFGQGGVVAFAVDGGDFATHGSEISGELAPMVNSVVEAKLEEEDGGLLEHAAEVDDFGELFSREFGECVEIFGVSLFVPGGNF